MRKNSLKCLISLGRSNHGGFRDYTASTVRRRICIVGSGPAGFYTAQHLLKNKSTEVDIYEKLPVPFGLIRYGVAPDHPEIKVVTNTFTKIASDDRCNFYGNINVGQDISITEFMENYHAVVLAFGANEDKMLDIPGEKSKNVISARSFVGWYNGHPNHINEEINLNTEVATVIGHGNVALDVARILLRPVEELKTTDISEHAYEALKKSKVQKVVLVGRRGPLQVSFTIKEFREMIKLSGCSTKMSIEDFKGIPDILSSVSRPKKRLMELMYDTASKNENGSSKICEIKFLRRPKSIVADEHGGVKSFIFGINKLEEVSETARVLSTVDEDIINCGLVFRSVGYRCTAIDPAIPFDNSKCIVPNIRGRVIGSQNLYCSGWVKTGPVGVILSTMSGSYETAEKVLEDLWNDECSAKPAAGKEIILKLLMDRGSKVTTFKHWQNIDKAEQERGKTLGKSRVKICDVDEMLKTAQLY